MWLPPNFKMQTLDKFVGTSCPKCHLRIYMRAMQPLGAIEELLAQMFQNTLTGVALRWFLNLDDTRARSWEDKSYKIAKISNIYKNDPHQLIVPISLSQISQGLPRRPRKEFHELYMPVSQVFEKLKAKGILKPLNPRPIPSIARI